MTTTALVRGARSPRPTSGRWIVARKELADHLLSARFAILLVVTTLAGLAAVNSAASDLRDAAAAATGTPSVFLLLFTVSPDRIPSFVGLIGFLGPLLGIGFGFDAVNSERAGRTLPRLVSQPIHRDDVIAGKFIAGLSLITAAVTTLTALVAGFGIVQLGVTPSVGEVGRLIAFVSISVAYIAVWLAFAILVSVLVRRSSTGVLACLGVWLILTLFAGLITGAVADAVSPLGSNASVDDVVANARTEQAIARVSPEQLYNEAVGVMLNPEARTAGVLSARQLDQAVPDSLPFDQSLLLVAPHITVLVATMVAVFSAAFLAFMRQEVRA